MLLLVILSACDTSIQPIVDKGKAYSIYGPLDIQKTPNYIRVHDTNDLLNPDLTKDLGVQVTMTNLNTGASQLLKDEVKVFDSLYTHNFEIPDSLEYDTRYKFSLEDEDGYRDSVISVTTKETELTVIQDSVSCGELFMLRFTNVDLNAGERIETEVGIKVGVAWMYTKRPANFRQYNSATNTLTMGWSPNYVSELIFGPFDWVTCSTFSSDKIKFSFTHVGYMEEVQPNAPNELEFDQLYTPNQVVLSKYKGSTEVTIDSTVFN
ncbi:MAG: hypothetical protein CL670_07145 [Balneola sp.]|jgi:hypothetical protein|nr:hypothetical protein [Balneola sp.]MBE78910.1 hypothetical protein [Balneola sp.]|tara:strand:- start:1345 stop:2139 length:795 start_codon:yes stop_codon:yes gene_type:complete